MAKRRSRQQQEGWSGAGRRGTLRVAMLAYPGIQMLDAMGPLEVFSRTSRWLKDHGRRADDAYSLEIVGLKRGVFRASSGLRLYADRGFDEVGRGVDTLMIAGGMGAERYRSHAPLVRWTRRKAGWVRRLASVCKGAFFLGEAGLLKGRRATTHWSWCTELASRYPDARVEPDPIFVKEGRIYTSAGVTAGMDLALALVEEDQGREVALAVARELVLFLRRPGGQAQFSAQLAQQLAEHEPLRDLQAYVLDHPREDLSVETLARRVAMSPRNFARVFTREVGTTPARFVTSVRVETARRLLEESRAGLEKVCSLSGLGTTESMRRAFIRVIGIPPGQYRDHFTRYSREGPRRDSQWRHDEEKGTAQEVHGPRLHGCDRGVGAACPSWGGEQRGRPAGAAQAPGARRHSRRLSRLGGRGRDRLLRAMGGVPGREHPWPGRQRVRPLYRR